MLLPCRRHGVLPLPCCLPLVLQVRERLCCIMLFVKDLHASLSWYTGAAAPVHHLAALWLSFFIADAGALQIHCSCFSSTAIECCSCTLSGLACRRAGHARTSAVRKPGDR